MGQARRDSFSSGRYCVRAAQAELAIPAQEIGRNERAPIWPQGCIGSISHSASVAVAALSTSLTGVGVDIERQGRVTGENLAQVIYRGRNRMVSHCTGVLCGPDVFRQRGGL